MTQTISQILTDKGDNKTWHPVARAITGCHKKYNSENVFIFFTKISKIVKSKL